MDWSYFCYNNCDWTDLIVFEGKNELYIVAVSTYSVVAQKYEENLALLFLITLFIFAPGSVLW